MHISYMNDDSKITENEKGDTGMEIVIARGKHIYIYGNALKCLPCIWPERPFITNILLIWRDKLSFTCKERDIQPRQCSYLCPILQTNCVLNSSHTTAGHRFSNTL